MNQNREIRNLPILRQNPAEKDLVVSLVERTMLKAEVWNLRMDCSLWLAGFWLTQHEYINPLPHLKEYRFPFNMGVKTIPQQTTDSVKSLKIRHCFSKTWSCAFTPAPYTLFLIPQESSGFAGHSVTKYSCVKRVSITSGAKKDQLEISDSENGVC